MTPGRGEILFIYKLLGWQRYQPLWRAGTALKLAGPTKVVVMLGLFKHRTITVPAIRGWLWNPMSRPTGSTIPAGRLDGFDMDFRALVMGQPYQLPRWMGGQKPLLDHINSRVQGQLSNNVIFTKCQVLWEKLCRIS